MAAEGKPSRNRLDKALVDRSRGTPRLRNEGLELAASHAKRAHGAAGPTSTKYTRPFAMTQTELDDIYSLGPDDSCGEEVAKRRRVLTKSKSDMGNVKAKSMPASSSSLPTAGQHKKKQSTTLLRSVSDSDKLPLPRSRRATPVAIDMSGVQAKAAHSEGLAYQSPRRPRPVQALSSADCANHALNHRTLLGAEGASADASSPSLKSTSPDTYNRPSKGSRAGRVRLIDRLAAQLEEDACSGSDMEAVFAVPISEQHILPPVPTAAVEVPATPFRGGTAAAGKAPGQSTKKPSNVKTYSQKRSIRIDMESHDGMGGSLHDLDAGLGLGDLTPSYKAGQPDLFAIDDEDMEDSRPRSGILGLHALRQAGANHRFANDLSDLFDRIGKPQPAGSSTARSRRMALLELGRNFHDKKFITSFCDDPSHEAMFRDMGGENDIINGFILLSSLVLLLTRTSSQHLAAEICVGGVDRLLCRMIRLDDDIAQVARNKSHNVSKSGRVSLDVLKSAMLQAGSIWGTAQPQQLTPRTLSLQSLTLLCRHAGYSLSSGIITPLIPTLFNLVAEGKAALELGGEDPISLVDLKLVLSLLEDCSMAALENGGGHEWLLACLPSVSSILSSVIHDAAPDMEDIGLHALKLAMNVSNSPQAAAILGTNELLHNLSQAAILIFGDLHGNIRHGQLLKGQYGKLVLVLGVLVNVTEHHPPARGRFSAWGDDPSLFDKLIAVYMDNRESSGKAESYEQTSLAVAHGYLAILLGYVSLDETTRQKMIQIGSDTLQQQVLGSIREFMVLHDKVTDVTNDDTTTSLVRLVNELQVMVERGDKVAKHPIGR